MPSLINPVNHFTVPTKVSFCILSAYTTTIDTTNQEMCDPLIINPMIPPTSTTKNASDLECQYFGTDCHLTGKGGYEALNVNKPVPRSDK